MFCLGCRRLLFGLAVCAYCATPLSGHDIKLDEDHGGDAAVELTDNTSVTFAAGGAAALPTMGWQMPWDQPLPRRSIPVAAMMAADPNPGWILAQG